MTVFLINVQTQTTNNQFVSLQYFISLPSLVSLNLWIKKIYLLYLYVWLLNLNIERYNTEFVGRFRIAAV